MEQTRFADIRVDTHGNHAVITMDREAKRNAMNRACRQGMMQALDFVRDRYPVVILTGVGGIFCAGIDLKERGEDIARGDASAPDEWIDVNVAIRAHSSIFIAAVNGTALGGGSTLINVCDLAVASETAELGMPEMSFATYPAMAGPATQLSVGRKRAAWMVLTAERVSAQQAMEWGIVNRCVPADQLMAEAHRIAERVGGFDAAALAGAKQALDQIPAVITDWRQAFNYAGLVNARIQQRRANANPFSDALANSRKLGAGGTP